MVPRENKNNAYAKCGGTNKRWYFPKWPIYTPHTYGRVRDALFNNAIGIL